MCGGGLGGGGGVEVITCGSESALSKPSGFSSRYCSPPPPPPHPPPPQTIGKHAHWRGGRQK